MVLRPICSKPVAEVSVVTGSAKKDAECLFSFDKAGRVRCARHGGGPAQAGRRSGFRASAGEDGEGRELGIGLQRGDDRVVVG